ncbi:hypothetical protein B6N60_01957 [Richelia sinica FACHB-800]|uniref:Uncharacterized protein n=1 Tax=Richelia sinica FACHB-800 TaxID=1357546 RepID=A0A975T6T7_9NOST|nr:hypothetical protein [Richelia sinica]QXE23268.1 hypothetical protein B6N60_01957 [Richelia sinica FACHB-800]
MDSQSVETATMVSKDVGYDSGKKIKGGYRGQDFRHPLMGIVLSY